MLSALRRRSKYVKRFAAAVSNCALGIRNALGQPHAMERERLQLVGTAERDGALQRQAKRQQVAAVCFRILSTGIEFLLVRTRRGRWTFPKGGLQSGLTHAQSAALEAYEEAGVHGRIEEAAFLHYKLRKGQETIQCHVVVHAHLCEVLRLDAPLELNREPTWFSHTKAKRRLGERRTRENGAELARVVDRAAARIRRMPVRNSLIKDPLFAVRFEACEVDVRSFRTRACMLASAGAENMASLQTPASVIYRNSRPKVLRLAAQPKRPQ